MTERRTTATRSRSSIRDRRRIDPETGEVRDARAARRRPAAGPVDGRRSSPPTELAAPGGRAHRRPAAAAGRVRQLPAPGRPRPRGRAGRAGARRSSSASCCRCSTTSTGPASTASSTAASRRSPTRSSTVVPKLGLEPFGEAGDPFDPTVHEALHARRRRRTSTEPTCVPRCCSRATASATASCGRRGWRSPSRSRADGDRPAAEAAPDGETVDRTTTETDERRDAG